MSGYLSELISELTSLVTQTGVTVCCSFDDEAFPKKLPCMVFDTASARLGEAQSVNEIIGRSSEVTLACTLMTSADGGTAPLLELYENALLPAAFAWVRCVTAIRLAAPEYSRRLDCLTRRVEIDVHGFYANVYPNP